MRCPCRLAAEKQWAIEALELQAIAWEACGGQWTRSRHRYRAPVVEYGDYDEEDW
jgi:hypothetical protein